MEAAYVIPKKELSSWQKWEFGSLDPLKSRQKTESPEKTPHTARSADQPGNQVAAGAKTTAHEAIVLPTAEQIEQIYQQAREEGKTAGYQEGMQQAKHAALVEVKHLQSLTSALEQELKQIDQIMAQDLLTLAIDLARKITSHALEIKPELILPVVEEALRQLPAISQPIRLTLHPDDAREYEIIWKIIRPIPSGIYTKIHRSSPVAVGSNPVAVKWMQRWPPAGSVLWLSSARSSPGWHDDTRRISRPRGYHRISPHPALA